jgi:formamidopyrimidine-DNA glycosylase
MPEVCEVCLTSEILNKELKNWDLTAIEIVYKKYKRVPKLLDKIKKSLPLEVINISSNGKLMWIEFNDDWYMTVGFGLEGKWSFEKSDYPKMKFKFKYGKEIQWLWWDDIFSYGNIVFYDNKEDFNKKRNELGMDLLKTSFTNVQLWNKIKQIQDTKYGDKMIVELLMDQKKLGSGLGNYLTPEILYRAKISPRRKIKSLIKKEGLLLSKNIKRVLKLCYYENKNKYMKYIEYFLPKHKRNKKYHEDTDISGKHFKFLVYRRKTDDYGNKVIADKIIKGRTTYWVKEVQQ